MNLVLGAADVQMLIAASMGLAGLLSLARRGTRRAIPSPAIASAPPSSPPDATAGWPALALLSLVLVVSAANYFLLGRDPSQFVKAWDVQHTWFGSKYAAELGYFRIYECMVFFDAGHHGRYRDVARISDLHRPLASVPALATARRSDCAARFSPERRAEFVRDLEFFQSLPRRPDSAAWFVDNGYNQSPFFTALTSPLFQRGPPSYGLLLGLTLVDVALELLPFALVWRAFGARTTLIAAIFFFTSFSNQFALMGGSILRFAYLALLLVAVCAAQRARPRATGVALGLATLLQVFPALYALGLAAAAAYRGVRFRRLPAWALPLAGAFTTTLLAGVAASFLVVAPETWREFAEKLALHGQMLSEYRVGLKLPLVLDWPVPPGGWLPFAQKLVELHALHMLHLACGAALLLAAVSLAPKLRALEFAIVFGTVALYVATPVHYYFATLVLLFLLAPADDSHDLATPVGRSLLFLLSAGAFLIHRSSGSLALVNDYWLSLGLLFVLVAWIVALHFERRPLEAKTLELEWVPRSRGAS